MPYCLSTWSCLTLVVSFISPLCIDNNLSIFIVLFHNVGFNLSHQPHLLKLNVGWLVYYKKYLFWLQKEGGEFMLGHPAISPTSNDLSESWWVESTNPRSNGSEIMTRQISNFSQKYIFLNFDFDSPL